MVGIWVLEKVKLILLLIGSYIGDSKFFEVVSFF